MFQSVAKMIRAIIFFALLFVVRDVHSFGYKMERFTEEIRQLLKPVHEHCLQKTGTRDEELASIDMENVPQHVKCFMTCMYDQAKWLKPDHSEFDLPYIMENGKFWKQFAEKAFDECHLVKGGPDMCDIGYNGMYCFYKLEPEKFYIA